MPLSQFGDSVRCCALADWRLALLRSRRLAPYAVPLSQPGALRCPPRAARRLALSRLSPPGA
eukprot:5180797-Pleurochrysis_carterae.AAC.1